MLYKIFILNLILVFTTVAYATEKNKEEQLSEEQKQTENANTKQLQSYDNITNWIIANDKNFEAIINETSKDSKTKWFIQEDVERSLKSQNIQETATSEEDSSVEKTEEKSTKVQIEHTVKKGETLFSIGRLYNVSSKDIKDSNNLESSTISVGKVLKIMVDPKYASEKQLALTDKTLPSQNSNLIETEDFAESIPVEVDDSNYGVEVKEGLDAQSGEMPLHEGELPQIVNYKVQKGDTLYSVARSHKMTKTELEQMNNLQPDSILSTGQILRIKSNYTSQNDDAIKGGIIEDGFRWPVVGRLLIPFGPQSGGVINEGINILAAKGTSVKAVQDGVVTYVGSELPSFGTMILIQHNNDWISVYAHLDSTMVTKGQKVKKGDSIGRVGTSGGVRYPQLHFELRYQVKPQDPLLYLKSY